MAQKGHELALEAQEEHTATDSILKVIKRFALKSVGWIAIYLLGKVSTYVHSFQRICARCTNKGFPSEILLFFFIFLPKTRATLLTCHQSFVVPLG